MITIDLEVSLAWDNDIGHFYGEGGWRAISFYRRFTMPFVPQTGTEILLPRGDVPDTEDPLDPIKITRVLWNEVDKVVLLDSEQIRMGTAASKEDVEDYIRWMLQQGFTREPPKGGAA